MRRIFVTGIGTDVGKTIASAVLTEALEADYWKPVQSGAIDASDSATVKNLISNSRSVFHKESYLLKEPVSPHQAAELEKTEIHLDNIQIPETENNIVIEGAGGLLVPLNAGNFVIDLITYFNAETVLVVKHYLGSINHTLLSIEALKNRNINIGGIIFCGTANEASEKIILKHHFFPFVGYIEQEAVISPQTILKYKERFSGI